MSPLLAVLALAAQGVPPAVEPYRAQGSGPSWSLTIAEGRMTYEAPGEPSVSVEAPPARDEEGMVTYEKGDFTVYIFHQGCGDAATGRRYADSVAVSVGRTERQGCGGAELPADSLNGTSWHFAEIAGEPTGLTGDIFRDDLYAIDFGPEFFVGYGGCNRFSAGYSQSGGILTTRPPFGSGTRNCREPVMGRERRLMEILSQPVRTSFPDADTLVLTGDKGSIKLVRTREEQP